MKLLIKKGRTSKLVHIWIQDSSSTTGAGLTGLTSGSAGLVCYRARQDDGNAGATQVTLSAGTRGTWSSGGFVEKDATNMPGAYELGLDNAGLATGVDSVVYMLKGATNMAPVVLEIQLVDFDPQDSVRLGLTCLPNTAVSTNASLLTSGTGADQLSVTSGRIDIGKLLGTAVSTPATAGIMDVNVKNWNNVAVGALPTNFSTLSIDGSGRIDLGKWIGTAPNALVGGKLDALNNIRNNTAQAGAASTITLDASASATDDYYKDGQVFILSGTGAGQVRPITGYVGSTKVATVMPPWATNPDNTSVFAVVAGGRVNITSNVMKGQGSRVEFVMTDSTTHNPKTGLTVASQMSKDGGALGATGNSVVEISNGLYTLVTTGSDMNMNDGDLRLTATGADDLNIEIVTQP